MLKQLLFFACLFLMFACTSNTNPVDQNLVDSTQVSTTPIVSDENVELVTYESATVYAANTIYGFKSANGDQISVSGMMYSDAGGEEYIEIPDNMIESSDTLDGLPAENPNYVGKTFKLYYGKDSVVYKIEMVN